MNEEQGFEIDMSEETPQVPEGVPQQETAPVTQEPAAPTPAVTPVVSDDDLRALEQQVQELQKQFEQNPQDPQLYARMITANAELQALKRVKQTLEPHLMRQQAVEALNTMLPQIEQEMSKTIPNFSDFRGNFERLMQQAVAHNPEIAGNPEALRATAELVAGAAFLQHVRGSDKPVGAVPADVANTQVPGVPNEDNTQQQLSPELQQAYETAKQFYPDLTPEDFSSYSPNESEYDLKLNIGGES